MTTKGHNKALELRPLTIEQNIAIDLLLTGMVDREVAGKVGVQRETVTRWRLYNPVFQAELNKRGQAISKSNRHRQQSLFSKALKVAEEVLDAPDHPDRTRVAMSLLRALTSSHAGDPCCTAPVEAAEIIDEKAKQVVISQTDDNPFRFRTEPQDSHREIVVSELEQKLGEPLTVKLEPRLRKANASSTEEG